MATQDFAALQTAGTQVTGSHLNIPAQYDATAEKFKDGSGSILVDRASTAEMQTGTLTTPRIMSPADIRAGVKTLQVIHNVLQTASSGNTVIPFDTTIPQNTEGTQIFSQAITPKSATSKIIIKCRLQVGANIALNLAAALFKDTTASALAAAGLTISSAAYMQSLSLDFSEVAGSTTARTYKVRLGNNNASYNWYLNQNSSAATLGGVLTSIFEISEIEV